MQVKYSRNDGKILNVLITSQCKSIYFVVTLLQHLQHLCNAHYLNLPATIYHLNTAMYNVHCILYNVHCTVLKLHTLFYSRNTELTSSANLHVQRTSMLKFKCFNSIAISYMSRVSKTARQCCATFGFGILNVITQKCWLLPWRYHLRLSGV